MANKIRLLLILSMIFAGVSEVCSDETTDRQIGVIYIKNAAAKYLLGDYDDSIELLDKAEEFYSTSSDFSYLKGLIILKRDNNINSASIHFKDALNSGDWLLLDSSECVSDLALLLFRKKEYDQIIDLIEDGYSPGYKDNDLMYLYLLSQRYMGDMDSYRNFLRQAMVRYPDDYRFADLYIFENDRYKREILNHSHSFKNRDGGMGVFLDAVFSLEDSQVKIRKLEEYISDGGKEHEAFIEYYRLTGSMSEDDLKRLLADGLLERPGLGRRLGEILPTEAMRQIFQNAVRSYTGNVYYDSNKDGFYEELHLYDNGLPAGISVDANQDGVLEKMIIFDNGSPVELIITENNFIRINFSNYPWLDELSSASDEKMNVYTFLTESVFLDFYEDRDDFVKPIIDDEKIQKFISELELYRKNAVKITAYTGGGSRNSFSFLEEEWERRDENSSILRIYNKLQGNYIYLNRYEQRTAGFGDIDFDSLIDFKETFVDGNLISIEADDNKNGIYDYKLSLEDGRSLSLWDFNEDGVYDCRQYEIDGIITTEYSSKLNGEFNVIERN